MNSTQHTSQNSNKDTNTSKLSNAPKYIPPHKRRQLANFEASSSNTQPQPILFSAVSPSSFTAHATVRKKQRDISERSINDAFNSGMTLEHTESITHIDETTQVVTGKDGKVITVSHNKRNSNFDIMRFSKRKEEDLIKKAERKNDYAMCELAELYLSGELGTRDVKKAYHWLLLAANSKGNSHAMCLLANIHGSGDLGAPDVEGELEWLEKAATRKNRYALAILGQRYLVRYLDIKDKPDIEQRKKIEMQQRSIHYLNQSADKGSTRAMWQLGHIAEEGLFGEKDLPKAVEFYTKAGRLGSPSSLDSLSLLVSSGVVTEEHFEDVLETASELIAKTSSELAVDVGLQQIEGFLGKNSSRGLKMIEKAAEKRNARAVKALAKCYREGKGCVQDLSISQQWFQKLKELYETAGRNGNMAAMFDLSRLHLSDKLGKIDLERAREILTDIEQTYDPDFHYYVGRLYREGRLGNYDPAEGINWINKAITLWTKQASRGNVEAAYELADVYLDKDLGVKDYQKAIFWLTILAKKKEPLAMILLSEIHLKEKPTLRNVPRAIKLLYLASLLRTDQENAQEATEKLESLLKRKDWPMEESNQIVLMLLKLAEESKEINPFRIGRILGDVFSQGNLVKPDFEKAIFWYEKSAKLQNSLAMFRLGKLYHTGVLGDVNLVKAIAWYDLSAKRKNKDAILQLGSLKDSTDLLDDSRKVIESWLNVYHELKQKLEAPVSPTAEDESSLIQKEKIENLYKAGLEEKDKDLQLGVYKLRKAAKEEHVEANFELGELYNSGKLGDKTRPVALLFYKRAGRKDHPGAIEKLIGYYTNGTAVTSDLNKAAKWRLRLERK